MFTIYYSDVVGQDENCLYPHKAEITDKASLVKAVSRDYVCAEYMNNYRSNDNFKGSDCLSVDCDNDHSNDPDDWIYPSDVAAAFPGVAFAVHYSRNHMKVKNGKTARPKFHIFFTIDKITDAEAYSNLKKLANAIFPYFDKKALDAAHFFYGTPNPRVEIFDGPMTLTTFLKDEEFDAGLEKGRYGERVIPEGSRNATMSHFAGRIIKKFGDTDEAYQGFLEEAAKCDPPLPAGELQTIWRSARKYYEKIKKQPGYISPEEYNGDAKWEEPLPFESEKMPDFPINALPSVLRDYAAEVGKSTQTPVDMAAVACLTACSACMRNLYKVEGKSDWMEPTNLYSVIIAEPSERKSSVIRFITKPIDDFIDEYNKAHSVDIEMSRARRQRLENKKNSLISQRKNKGEEKCSEDFDDALRSIVDQIVNFKDVKPMRVYVDDVTPEKLTEALAENDSAISIISSEGGIFDVLSGTYSNKVNIDVFLKAYSGENISVDRIMRQSISVRNACLTILLSAQPIVISELMSNKKFRHRGLTARFLYTTPRSLVGSRSLNCEPVSAATASKYKSLIYNILQEQRHGEAEIIHLTNNARQTLSDFYDWVEKRLAGEFSMYSDWLGKLVGNTLRIAGVLARCSVFKKDIGDAIFECDNDVVIDDEIMNNAIKIGRYFLVHAVSAYGSMGIRSDFKTLLMVLEKLKEKKPTSVTRRDIMRFCHWVSSADEAQNILNSLEDYGYVRMTAVDISDKLRCGRPKNAVYSVNPKIFE